ncbi:MAG: ABC transporter ATP-binding protein [Kiloniellales bacterium]|nr:ABC transporter ATP-binding protein [Kiloniellales bacterium]
MSALLAVEDVRVRFRVRSGLQALVARDRDPFIDAVCGVSFEVGAGETFGIVGESGSGKTTLARAIAGLLPAQEGSIRFGERELRGLAPGAFKALRRDIAMMFQDPIGSLSPRLTVRALVTEPFKIHGLAERDLEAECRRLLEMVGLPAHLGGRYPYQLSGGQARRVGVARALALSPKLVIADEPTAGLDVSVQGEILNLMATLQAELGLSYLIISHNLPVVRHISDALAIMYLGRIIEQGDCARIFAAPAHPYTEALVKGVPQPDPGKRRSLVSIEGEVPSLARRPAGCEFHTRCAYAQERCRREAPAPRRLADGRLARCHFPLTETESAA